MQDHFPPTPRTLVHEALDGGDPQAVAAHLIRLYERPLRIYFGATSFRNLGDPEDIVAGFLADRLSRSDWLQGWRDACRSREIPLRRWLLNALNFYLKEEARRAARDRRLPEPTTGATSSEEGGAERTFEREAARAVVAEALARTEAACREVGQSRHYEVFVRHTIDRQPYETIGPALGLSLSQCGGQVRTVTAKFRRAVAEVLAEEGIEDGELDREIVRLMEALRP
ncbi:MAG: ubiquitin-like domain-containing protein [Planctomycetaceae bacterium]|nr:ubiquitin-like domain-containing protein [Planctomycetaceae bacterium]